jgi:putative N6-adenine-specific DNA methylase
MLPNDFLRDKSPILITCPKGLAPFLYEEVRECKMPVIGQYHTSIRTHGTLTDCMLLNLSLSTAHHVLFEVLTATCASPDELYGAVHSLEWERLIPLDTTLAVTSTVKTASITDTRFANLKCKDAIVDRLVQKTGSRCNSGPGRDGVVVHLYWQDEKCVLYLDTSGESLSRRGYRLLPGPAPMQETLASGVVHATNWNRSAPFVNPMCGTGTLAIEAALIALNRKPGTIRSSFGFMHLLPYDKKAFQTVWERLASAEHSAQEVKIIATDIDPERISDAQKNAAAAGVGNAIEFSACEFEKTPVPGQGGGVVVLNPEYGFRMGEASALQAVYKGIGDFFKQRCAGYTGYVFSGNFDLVKKVGLKAKRKTPFYSGSIECRLYEYELYSGSRPARPVGLSAF